MVQVGKKIIVNILSNISESMAFLFQGLKVNVTNLNCGNTIQTTTNKRLKWYV